MGAEATVQMSGGSDSPAKHTANLLPMHGQAPIGEPESAGSISAPGMGSSDAAGHSGKGAAPPPALPAWRRVAAAVWKLACDQWFILGLGVAIGLAAAVPSLGKTGALCSGWLGSSRAHQAEQGRAEQPPHGS